MTFANEDARRFSNGEWLETLVHSTVKQIKMICRPFKTVL
ncbi:DUF1887 family CARF protein [Vibrio lentus]|nr:DUF1887 family CARF protein [Vibrio lentus]